MPSSTGGFAVALVLCGAPVAAAAQGASPHPTQPLVTLTSWAEDLWLGILDRDGAYFGRLADEGIFQRFHPQMDDEYALDELTGLFTAAEDVRWSAVDEGFRAAGASVNHPFILNVADWRERAPVTESVAFLAKYRREGSLTAQRDHLRVGMAWSRGSRGSQWSVGAQLGVHFFKPSADVEVTAGWRGTNSAGASWRVDGGIALLDVFNDFIFNTLGVQPDEVPAHFDYEGLPLAGRVGVTRVGRLVRFEVHSGVMAPSRVRVTFPGTADPGYLLTEAVAFAGGLVDLSVARGFGVAAYATVAWADTERRFEPEVPDDLELTELTGTLGLEARAVLSPSLHVTAGASAVWRPERRLEGRGAEVRRSDRQVFGRVAVERAPRVGWTWRLSYAGLDRESAIMPELTAAHHRHTMEAGHRFSDRFAVVGGLRWDLDALRRAPFDGGHLRFTATW